MNFSDLFKVMITERQITWKWYNIQLYNGWAIESRIWSIEHRHFHWSLTTLTSSFKVTPFDADCLRNGTIYRLSVIDILIGTYTPYATVSFWMILSDLEWLAKYSMTQSITRSRCDSWASLYLHDDQRPAELVGWLGEPSSFICRYLSAFTEIHFSLVRLSLISMKKRYEVRCYKVAKRTCSLNICINYAK